MTRSSVKILREPYPDPELLFRLAKINSKGEETSNSDQENEYHKKTPPGTPPKTPDSTPPPSPRTQQRNREMADQAALEAMTMEERMKATRTGQGSAIVVPAIAADFEIKG